MDNEDINTHADCNGTGWLMCDHTGPRDSDGWCEACGTPGDLKIDGLVKIFCSCQD